MLSCKNVLKTLISQFAFLNSQFKVLPLQPQNMGKSRTASSLRILQDGNVAKVVGCSGAIRVACPPASLAQLARARDL